MDTVGRRIGKKAGKKKAKGIIKPYLPDDIIPNILYRLPAKNACQCRLVCKGWRDLLLSHDFVDLHFRHSFPLIMFANPELCCRNFDYFLLDKWWETTRMKLMIHRFTSDQQKTLSAYSAILFSHVGLIVFKEFSWLLDIVILNPINLERVKISVAKNLHGFEIYGVFFHPSLREYCSLWRMEVSHDVEEDQLITGIFYKMLILGSNPLLKTISYPFYYRKKRYDRYPLLIDKYLYWMLECDIKQDFKSSGSNDIMQFDIISEEFVVKPCPVPVDTECEPNQTHLLNIDGALSFLVIFSSNITIWRLQDHAGQLWTSTNYTFSTANFCNYPKPIAVINGNLALLCDRRLLVCDLIQGTLKCFRKQKYHSCVLFLSHQLSLASLSNCQSTIYLDKKGEVSSSRSSDSSDSSPWGSPYNVNFEISSSDEDERIIVCDELW